MMEDCTLTDVVFFFDSKPRLRRGFFVSGVDS